MNKSSDNNEPSLASIFELVKSLSESNSKTSNLVEKLSSRIDLIEAGDVQLSDGSIVRKRKTFDQRGGPSKCARLITDSNNNCVSDNAVVENSTLTIQGTKQPGPFLGDPLANSLSSISTSSKQPGPFIGDPSAIPGIIDTNITAQNPLIINATMSDDCSNLELQGDNVDLEELENMYLANEEDSEPQSNSSQKDHLNADQITENTNGSHLPIICNKAGGNWHISDDTFKWFETVADLELNEDQLRDLEDTYTPEDDIAKHFIPPPVPAVFQQKMRNNNAEQYKQRSIVRAQKMSTLAVKPLLSVLDSLDQNDHNVSLIASAVQLICSSNLQLSRYRRASTSKFMKNEVKGNLFSLPVNHLNLFGSDFESAAEHALKSQNSSHKVLFHPKPQLKSAVQPSNDTRPQFAEPSTSNAFPRDKNQPFRQRRGRSYGRGRSSFHKRK